MPELPEVESLRRSIEARLRGSVVRSASVARVDMLHRSPGAPATPLPAGCRLEAVRRHGKQLVIEGSSGCLLVHLGMSGSLRIVDSAGPATDERHVHAHWVLACADGAVRTLRHRDPRRFGWLESHADLGSVRQRCWSGLGPDALGVRAQELAERLRGTRRPIKAALLDQSVVAGIGNIYADESLFRARVHPCMRAHRLDADSIDRLARAIRSVLAKAVELGGSTIQDHRTVDGGWGSFQRLHRVYGRAGSPCHACGVALKGARVQQRATVFCPACQRLRQGPASVQGRSSR